MSCREVRYHVKGQGDVTGQVKGRVSSKRSSVMIQVRCHARGQVS